MIITLDFDGVICDSAIETAITGWKVAQNIWDDMPVALPKAQAINNFREVRPFLETGYEAILIMRLLYQGVSVAELCSNYDENMQQIININGLRIDKLKHDFGETRDCWIKTAPQEWLSMNPLFAGIANQLKTLADSTWYIITTKQQRFVTQILQANNIEIDEQNIFGMECQQSKIETLLQLQKRHPKQTITFVEDRLPTLINIQNTSALHDIHLQFATWGYNTAKDKMMAKACGIELIHVEELVDR